MLASGNRAYGVEITILDDGSLTYTCFEIIKVKQMLQPGLFQSGLSDLASLKKLLKNDFPVVVVLNGKGILQKSIDNLINPTAQQFFPGINLSEFYYDHITNFNQVIGYLMRRKALNEIVDTLLDAGLNVINAYVGYAVIGHTLPYIAENIKENSINLNGTKFFVHVGQEESPAALRHITLGTDEIPVFYFTSYCAAISYFLPLEAAAVDYPVLLKRSKEFESHKRLSRIALIFLSVVLVLLLVGNVLKFQYATNTEELKLKGSLQQDNSSRDSLIALINQKKRFLKDGNWTLYSRASFFADRIANSVEGVRLSSVNVFPKYKHGEDEDLKFKSNNIYVAGFAEDELQLKKWIDKIRLESWVEDASVDNYEWDSQKRLAKFEIALQVK